MKGRYVVLVDPAKVPSDPSAWTLRPDGRAWLGLLFPIPWLLFNRLWLYALGFLGLLAASTAAVTSLSLPAVAPLLVNCSLGVLVYLEGRHWVVSRETRRARPVLALNAMSRAHAEDEVALIAALAGNR